MALEDVDQMPIWLVRTTTLSILSSMIISFYSIFLHLRNYRKPMDQRLIVRILLLIPIYAASSWMSLHWEKGSRFLDPIREVYEAFIIYTFFTLLTNILGGERDIIISCSGRPPKSHLFPLNKLPHLDKVDISDPYTFLTIKRGILQYTWLKPVLALLTVIFKATGTYRANVVALNSGYFWIGLIYNVSISVSLYCLALFWYCLYEDLAPYRPMPKFLCIKAVIFFSFWQGFAISLLKLLGLFVESGHMIQNTLLSFEMLPFAIGHWYAFSYQDYATSKMIGFGRLPIRYAIRDAFGIVDLICDFESTFYGNAYGYRQFDSVETLLDHPESKSRTARINAGLRYRNGGRSKYWLPKNTLAHKKIGIYNDGISYLNNSNDYSDSDISSSSQSLIDASHPTNSAATYGSLSSSSTINQVNTNIGSSTIPLLLEERDDTKFTEEDIMGDEGLYKKAKSLPYGDYNYPVITIRESIPYKPIFDQQKARSTLSSTAALRQAQEHPIETEVEDEEERSFFESSYSKKKKKKKDRGPSAAT